ncbi:MAG: hypothetical protein CMO81_06835 [Waddliaceae bacterium]|nr:hypothetical protein [Waddliaceae bacterium]
MDIREEVPYRQEKRKEDQEANSKKAFISVYWKCCRTFSRVYKSKDGKTYTGSCPKCRSILSVPIGAGGTTQRTFIAE